jgi:hypothetical protein
VCPVKPVQFTQSTRGDRYLRKRLDEWLDTVDPNEAASPAPKRRIFTNGDIDRKDGTDAADANGDAGADDKAGYPKWRKLAAATREDYLDAFDYLRPEFDLPLADITQPDLYDLRDTCANQKWGRFADQMISALSSMFTQGVKRGNRTGMTFNPCRGMDKAHAADPNANREWFKGELPIALQDAPMEVKIPLMLARYGGLRGQSIVVAGWKQYQADELTGMCFRFVTRKNQRGLYLPPCESCRRSSLALVARQP